MLPFLFNKPKPPVNITQKSNKLTPPLIAENRNYEPITEYCSNDAAIKGLSQQEINKYVESIDGAYIPKLAELDFNQFNALIKNKIPSANQENVLDGYNLIQKRNEAINGK